MDSPRVVVVHYRLWPGMGYKGAALTAEGARQMIGLLKKNYRQAGFEIPPADDGFQLIELPIDVLPIGDRRWLVGDGGPREVRDDASPEVSKV